LAQYPLEILLDDVTRQGVHKGCPALYVMPGGSFNLIYRKDAVHEGGAHAPQLRGSLKPSILAPTW